MKLTLRKIGMTKNEAFKRYTETANTFWLNLSEQGWAFCTPQFAAEMGVIHEEN